MVRAAFACVLVEKVEDLHGRIQTSVWPNFEILLVKAADVKYPVSTLALDSGG